MEVYYEHSTNSFYNQHIMVPCPSNLTYEIIELIRSSIISKYSYRYNDGELEFVFETNNDDTTYIIEFENYKTKINFDSDSLMNCFDVILELLDFEQEGNLESSDDFFDLSSNEDSDSN